MGKVSLKKDEADEHEGPRISIIIPTFNAAKQTSETVTGLSRVVSSFGGRVEIILVDDGSTESERKRLSEYVPAETKILLNEQNEGRGAACNSGAEAANGDYLLFLDCDCRPQVGSFLQDHLTMLRQGNDVSLGSISTTGTGFWEHYQHQAADRRIRKFAAGQVFAMTSANMMIKREWFEKVGGFDLRYRGYGFEDRDLILRLSAAGARLVASAATVMHAADLNMPAIVRKMAEAGRTTAPLFRESHREAYRKLGYAAIDVSLRPWLIPFAWLSGKAVSMFAPHADWWIERLPFALASVLVKSLSAAAFMSGAFSARCSNG